MREKEVEDEMREEGGEGATLHCAFDLNFAVFLLEYLCECGTGQLAMQDQLIVWVIGVPECACLVLCEELPGL